MKKLNIYLGVISVIMLGFSTDSLYGKKMSKDPFRKPHSRESEEKAKQRAELVKSFDWTPLQIAINSIDFASNPDLISMLIGVYATDQTRADAHKQIAEAAVEKIKKLIAEGEDIHKQGKYGNTPLLHALCSITENENNISQNHSVYYKVIEYLLNLEDDVPVEIKQKYFNTENIDGLTALDIAVLKAHWNIVLLLLQKGADINYINSNDQTALDYLSENKIEAVQDMGWSQGGVDKRIDSLKKMGAKSNRSLDFWILSSFSDFL